MKPVKPFVFGAKSSKFRVGGLPSTKKVSTFAQKRSQTANSRLNKALDERKKMIRAQYAADKLLDNLYKVKGNILDRKINRIKSSLGGSRDR